MYLRKFSSQTTYEHLLKALRNGEIKPLYQPQYDIDTGNYKGVEALIRWFRNDGVVLSPVSFLSSIKRVRMMDCVGFSILESICNDMLSEEWKDTDIENVSINYSCSQMLHPEFVETVSIIIRNAGVPYNRFTFELTEADRFVDTEKLKTVLKSLREMGIKISLDDFCTGFSTLKFLKTLPFDELKIDQGYVENVHYCKGSQAICAGIIAMASHFDARVVAEGVENVSQFRALEKLGCKLFQGYLYARPTSIVQLADCISREAAKLKLVAYNR